MTNPRVLHDSSNALEVMQVAKRPGVPVRLLSRDLGTRFIERVLDRYRPGRTTGHLAIQHDSIELALEPLEFSSPEILEERTVYIFWAQSEVDTGNVVSVSRGRDLKAILENAFGMEYFLTDKNGSFLIAVNWYVLEAAGDIVQPLLAWARRAGEPPRDY